ncbi:acyclic terpene utilization AtuA family protein [Clostridium sp. C2-6-12]|uniref:acyclic terpene utilization AtuA family protein n=1 Tax=Clostridium sp. C2-6-12 TaxID=2698832 RepID=UPI00136ACE2F|nr:acyclic terpene utilization AtuA family protein [Clostridium sp. C2-6-12]
MKSIRIGGGAGYGGDRIEPAVDLIKYGKLDYIIFECLAERTIALGQLQKLSDNNKGYNELLEYRMEKVLPLIKEKNIKVITNMGSANPISAMKVIKEMAKAMNISGLKIAAVLGDDISDNIEKYLENQVIETGEKLKSVSNVISANAYIGCKGIVEALENGADIVVTGRVADPSLVLGPLVYEFKWNFNDYDLLGKGTLAGHLLECAAQVMGGYFVDPPYKEIKDLWNLGFPIGEVNEEGRIVISKLEQAGGQVTIDTCKEQILYEIQDPENYFTPDVIADFSKVRVKEIKKDEILVEGASGKAATGLYKTSVGYKDCYIGEGEISYGGTGAYERAKIAGEIIKKRLEYIKLPIEELKIDYIGVNSLYDASLKEKASYDEVRLRVAARTLTKKDAIVIGNEVEALYTNGPAGGGGARKYVREVVSIASILIPAEDIKISVQYEEV